MNADGQIWLMLAFPRTGSEPAMRAFAQAKSGKSYYRKLLTRDAALACKRELVEAGIRYLCKKVEATPGSRSTGAGRVSRTSGYSAGSRNPHNSRRHGR